MNIEVNYEKQITMLVILQVVKYMNTFLKRVAFHFRFGSSYEEEMIARGPIYGNSRSWGLGILIRQGGGAL